MAFETRRHAAFVFVTNATAGLAKHSFYHANKDLRQIMSVDFENWLRKIGIAK
jgi:hypothetical protein